MRHYYDYDYLLLLLLLLFIVIIIVIIIITICLKLDIEKNIKKFVCASLVTILCHLCAPMFQFVPQIYLVIFDIVMIFSQNNLQQSQPMDQPFPFFDFNEPDYADAYNANADGNGDGDGNGNGNDDDDADAYVGRWKFYV